MFTRRVLVVLALAISGAVPFARAQDDEKDKQAALRRKLTLELLEKAKEEYRVFFKKPETAIEYWSAIKFEMELGKFDLAALHLKRMLNKDPQVKGPDADALDKALVKLEEAEGTSAFLRLQNVRPTDWSNDTLFRKEAVANVDTLIDRVTTAVEKHLSDPARIKKYIARLNAPTPEERAYAYVQVARSRERAIPYLIEELRTKSDKPIFPRLRETMLRMGPETVPVYLEAFKAANDKDYSGVDLRLTLLDLVKKRDDKRVIPYLWHMHASKKYPLVVRTRAKETLASLLRVSIEDVPPAKESLTYLAERYYQHKIAFPEGKGVKFWSWDGQAIALKPVELTPYQAEEFLGLRYARQALDLDPGYRPAQVVFMSLMLERYYRPKVDKILTEKMPAKMHQLLTSVDADLLLRVLERAMEDRQLPVVLPLVQALGERGEFRAIQFSPGGQPRGLVQALYYPDRRVQYAALKAMLNMPASAKRAVASDRIVDLSRRFLTSDLKSKALVVSAPIGQQVAVRKTVSDLGFQPELADKIKDAVAKGKASADFDIVFLHHGTALADFPHVYSQLRQQYDIGGLPMIVIVEKARERTVKKLVASNPNAVVITDDRFAANEDLKNTIESLTKKAMIAKLTAGERKDFMNLSMQTLWRIGKGELKGYDLAPALDTIIDQLKSKDYSGLALEILGQQPGRAIQMKLAAIVGNPDAEMNLRKPAALELNRHMQKNGVLIGKKQQTDLRLAQAKADADFRTMLNITLSMIARPGAPATGADLFKFRPDDPAPKK
ncbi:MAG: hypothetical protein HYX68_28220 [Planctomycetes bacterium]|nr:hypothetical protein [Planctomycetota bacterium]